MDYNYLENCIREEIQRICPDLPKEIIEEFFKFTFWYAPWVKYGNNQNLYILGLAQGKYDFYYLGCDDNYEIKLISCALQIEKIKKEKMIIFQNLMKTLKNGVKNLIEFGK